MLSIKVKGLSARTETHYISIVCEVFHFSLVLKFYCFLSSVSLFYVFVLWYTQKEPNLVICGHAIYNHSCNTLKVREGGNPLNPRYTF